MSSLFSGGPLGRPAFCTGFGIASSALILLIALPGQAHHLVEVTQLSPTVWNGLLSGLAHPVLGPDHLLFLLALTLLGLRQRRRWLLALLAVGLLGSAAGLLLPALPAAELILAATLGLEALVLLGHLPAVVLLPAMALHGFVLSAAVLGWSAMPVASYLVGLMLSQAALLLVALALLTPAADRLSRSVNRRRWLAAALFALAGSLALAAELG